MSEGVLREALAGVVGRAGAGEWGEESLQTGIRLSAKPWDPQKFAQAQIQGLVRQVFSMIAPRPVRQVVITAVDVETEVRDICLQVAETLARETVRDVAVLGSYLHAVEDPPCEPGRTEAAGRNRSNAVRQAATPLQKHVWLLPITENGEDYGSAEFLHAYLGEVRGEFAYSIVAAPSAEESNQAMAMAQFADGVILVLSAQRTRRVTARRIKERLEEAQVRLLGTVLSDRLFPIPAGIYRRL